MMKALHKLGLGLILPALLVSCAKDKVLDFQVAKPESLAIQEQIDTYDALKTFLNREANPGFKLGGAADLASYMQKGVMYRLLNNNFDEITLGYEMKHGAVVDNNGNMNFTNVNALLDATKAAGISVYGHTLCWHANQNATYLKGLLAPLIVKTPSYANSLPLASLKDGSFSGWSRPQSGAGISVVANQGMVANTQAVKLVSGTSSSNATDLQLISPGIPVVSGHKYEVVCYIKSSAPGEGRLAFEGLNDNTPKADWTKSGTATETFKTNGSWKEIRVQIDGFTGSTFKVHFDLGYRPDVTYYLDVNNLYVYDMQGTPLISNQLNNGDFEAGNINGWGGWGNGSTMSVSASGQGSGSKGYAMVLNNPSVASAYYVVQAAYNLTEPLKMGETYNLSFWVKGDVEGVIRPEMQSPTDYSSNGFGQVQVTREWKQVKLSATISAATRSRLIISYGELGGKVYLDDIVLSSASNSGGGSVSVEKTPEERTAIIGNALDTWIKAMVTNCKKSVKAWDVLNEPMDDGRPSELKTGVGRTLKSDEFYWQDYLGKDYGVTAFKTARQNGNPDDIHFVNDYNLEYNLDKCRGLIEYVKYMESKGARIDGIGTQMHISLDVNKSNIDEMLRLLAATGKLIKISELDIGLNTAQATPELLNKQAELYKYVVNAYFKYVPKAQRYGITVWGVLDSPDNSSWRPGEKLGLWDLRYTRKPAYKSFAEGLAQK